MYLCLVVTIWLVISEKEKFGGGSIRNVSISDRKGGNAVNIAYCLAKLGVKVILFTVANEYGSNLLKQQFSKFGDRVELIISDGKHGHTVVMEFQNDLYSKINIMLNDVGDIAHFGPDRIDNEDTKKILCDADGVMVVNWGSNLKGTELIKYTFKNSHRGLHFIDPADLDNRKDEFINDLPQFSAMTNTLSINENECNSILTALGLKSYTLYDIYDNNYSGRIEGENGTVYKLKELVSVLANKININTIVHTKKGAVWSDGQRSVFAPSFKVNTPHVLTGAGDTWNAANIVSNIIELSREEQLIFSNACASLYITNPFSEPPSIQETLNFLKDTSNKF
jgi:ribokinase